MIRTNKAVYFYNGQQEAAKMIKDLFNFWRSREYKAEVMDQFAAILRISDDMYKLIIDELFHPASDDSLKEKIVSMDKQINELQRSIRRRIVEHIAVAPTDEPNVSLIWMSVVKDAERLGDYNKNIYDSFKMLESPVAPEEWRNYFDELFNTIDTFYKKTSEAFIQFDREKAVELIPAEREVKRQCRQIIQRLAGEKDISVNRAVCFSQIAHHLKRIAAHLCNICSAVVMPVESIDYTGKRFRAIVAEEE